MAAGLRTIKIKFTGDSKDLEQASRQGAKALAGFGKSALTALAGFGSKVGDAIGSAVEALPPQGKLVGGLLVAGLSAAVAPAIGAAISAGVLLGVGGGVLAFGIKLAAGSPEVKAAGQALKDRFMDMDTADLEKQYAAAQQRMTTATGGEAKKRAAAELAEAKKALDEANAYNTKNFSLKDAAQPLVGPLVKALETFQAAADRIIPKVKGWFEQMAPVIQPLADGLVKMAEKAFPGIDKAVQAAVPLFVTLGEKLPEIGAAIGRFFEKIAGEGPNANTFFSDLLDILIGTIDVFGSLISWLASWYDEVKTQVTAAKVTWIQFKIGVIDIFGSILDAAISSMSWVPGLGGKLAAAKEKFAQFRRDANAELAQIQTQFAVYLKGYVEMGFKSPQPSQFTGRASGGPVRAGSMYLVGERGPEVVQFGQNGTVTPNRELQTGGGDMHLHIDLGGGVQKVITVNNRDLRRQTRARRALQVTV